MEQSQQEHRQANAQQAVNASKQTNQLSKNSRVFVPPKNNIVKPLEKVLAPTDLFDRESAFARSVAVVLGLPGSGGGGQVPLFIIIVYAIYVNFFSIHKIRSLFFL